VANSGLAEPGLGYLVGLSGGPDSTALLSALLELGREVTAAHYDHRLRDGSEDDADHVAEFCRGLGVRLIRGRRSEELPRGSLQDAARRLRYAFLETARVEAGAEAILLAHTADDVVEGAVLHLLRGCGLAGLRGMPARRGYHRRPLLGVWRSQVETYLKDAGIAPLRDPSNSDVRFRRAWVRHRLLPQLEADRPGIVARLQRAANRAAQLQTTIEAAASRLDGVPRSRIGVASPVIRGEVYRRMYGRAGGPQPGLARRHLEQIDRLVRGGRAGSRLDLPRGIRLRIEPGMAWMEAVGPKPTDELPFRGPAQANLMVRLCPGCDERDAVHLDPARVQSGRLRIGHRRPGLRIRPAFGRGTRKLQDILVDAKVPRGERDNLILVFLDERLAWVPGLAVEADLVAVRGRPSLHVSLGGGCQTPC
jgi:tRNA(Ile)-lysidine synthetase-like protein